MALSSTAQRPAVTRRNAGPLVWQRTGTIGTELVLGAGDAPSMVTGSAVVDGPMPYATRWHADLDPDWRVRSFTVTCEGHGWRRNLALARTAGGWTAGAEQSGGPDGPPPGLKDPGRLTDDTVLVLDDSPIFLTWALRRLRLGAGSGPAGAPVARIGLPWLTVVPAPVTFHRVGEHRLRVTGDGPVASYDLDGDGIVTYQPGRLRITR